jgi:hypothetical protein
MQTTLDKQYERDANFRKDLEQAAEMSEYYGNKILELAKRIETMPLFPQGEITRAEEALEKALQKLLEAKLMLDEKPRKQ